MEAEDSDHNESMEDRGPRRLSNSVKKRITSMNRSRSKGAKKVLTAQETAMEKSFKKLQRDRRNEARAGEGDRKIYNMMPKHLYTGKSGIGKKDYR